MTRSHRSRLREAVFLMAKKSQERPAPLSLHKNSPSPREAPKW